MNENDNDNTVFCLSKKTEQNEIAYADALRFGKLNFILEQFIDFHNFDESLNWLAESLIPLYNEDDYILLTGNVMICCLAVQLMLRHFKSIKILLFDGRKNIYISRVLTDSHFSALDNIVKKDS